MKNFVRLVSATALAAVCLVGCGEDDGDGGSYGFVEIDGLKWMKKNLNIETADSWCYENSADSCKKYGRLYTWDAAKTACPSGWRLPSRSEWVTLAKAAGGTGYYGVDGTAGKKLKAASRWNENGNGTDGFGFSALPGGYRNTGGGFEGTGIIGNWWTATEYGSGNAYYRYMTYNNDGVLEYDYVTGYGRSVRCVKDE